MEHRRKRRIAWYGIVIAGCLSAGFLLFLYGIMKVNVSDAPKEVVIAQQVSAPTPKASVVPTSKATSKPSPSTKVLPNAAKLTVSFTTQAPFANWDALHEDACEEASLIMVKHYLSGQSLGSKSDVDQEITNMVAYEQTNGYGLSISLQQLSDIAKSYVGQPVTSGKVEYGITTDSIKRAIADGKPVIVGAAGKVLPNPNFRNGGPNYHMLVVVGYDEQGFITNDPGTRLGEGFRYSFDGLFDAIHDWDASDILNGPKAMLTF